MASSRARYWTAWSRPVVNESARACGRVSCSRGASRCRCSPSVDEPTPAIAYLRWSTVVTPHFRVHFHGGLREVAERVANVAENAHDTLVPELGWEPLEVTHILVADDSDAANGLASTLPYDFIRIFVSAPDDMSPLADYDDWITELITHEYAHPPRRQRVGPACARERDPRQDVPSQSGAAAGSSRGLAVAMESATRPPATAGRPDTLSTCRMYVYSWVMNSVIHRRSGGAGCLEVVELAPRRDHSRRRVVRHEMARTGELRRERVDAFSTTLPQGDEPPWKWTLKVRWWLAARQQKNAERELRRSPCASSRTDQAVKPHARSLPRALACCAQAAGYRRLRARRRRCRQQAIDELAPRARCRLRAENGRDCICSGVSGSDRLPGGGRAAFLRDLMGRVPESITSLVRRWRRRLYVARDSTVTSADAGEAPPGPAAQQGGTAMAEVGLATRWRRGCCQWRVAREDIAAGRGQAEALPVLLRRSRLRCRRAAARCPAPPEQAWAAPRRRPGSQRTTAGSLSRPPASSFGGLVRDHLCAGGSGRAIRRPLELVDGRYGHRLSLQVRALRVGEPRLAWCRRPRWFRCGTTLSVDRRRT